MTLTIECPKAVVAGVYLSGSNQAAHGEGEAGGMTKMKRHFLWVTEGFRRGRGDAKGEFTSARRMVSMRSGSAVTLE